MVKALVTGGTGFIGSHLVEALLAEGVEVRCLIRKTSNLAWIRDLPIDPVFGDCSDSPSLERAVRDVDLVFHLAGTTKATHEKTYFEVNAVGTANLVHACLHHNPHLRKFIYLSSQAAAGPCRNGSRKRESDACDPVSPYGRSKRRGEELALSLAHQLPLLILRPTAVYGPRDRDFFAFFKCLSRRIRPCFSDQEQWISLCYIQDLIRAILLSARAETRSGEIFFLSDGLPYRMEEVGDAFSEAMGVRPVCIPIPNWALFGVASCSDALSKLLKKPSLINKGKAEEMVQKDWSCDITKARTFLNFEPQIRLPEGAKLTVAWYKKEKWL